MKIILITFIIAAFQGQLLSQSASWSKYEKLYSDNLITVEVSFKIPNNTCQSSESVTPGKYRYRITGQPRSYDYYLNWKMDYMDCNGNLYYRNNSLDIGVKSKSFNAAVSELVIYPDDEEFSCKSLEQAYYEATGSSTKIVGGGLKAVPLSKDPTSVIGEEEIYYGEQTVLQVKGGALGVGAKWVWYEAGCGGKQVGTGESITVKPVETTTYYIRAEGPKNTTNCAQKRVTVNLLSKAPTSVEGVSRICAGEKLTLSVRDGRLGMGAEWVWYENQCGGKEVGRGKSITVYPNKSADYFVRAEGKYNKTECVQLNVSVNEKSASASMISSSNVECANQKITLSVVGGNLAQDAQWKWYSGSCENGYYQGNGPTIEVVPMSSATYFVRAEGLCNRTECARIDLNPYKISYAPGYLSYTERNGNKYELSFYGGSLGKDAKWKWYTTECGEGRAIGTGSSIVVHPRKSTTYFLRAEGPCNTTECVSQYISPRFDPKLTPVNSDSKKFLHLGIGLGIDVSGFSTKVLRAKVLTSPPFTRSESSVDRNVTGFGAKGEFVFHPYMKDFFAFGLVAGGAVGTTVNAFKGGKVKSGSINETEKYLYTRFDIGGEITAGSRVVKVLLAYKSSLQTHQLSFSGSDGNATYNSKLDMQLRREVLSGGLRFGAYSLTKVRYRRGFCIDLVYHLSRDYDWQWKKFNWSYNALSNYQSGGGLALWIQSILKMQVDLSYATSLGHFTSDANKIGFQFSMIYNRNAFY